MAQFDRYIMYLHTSIGLFLSDMIQMCSHSIKKIQQHWVVC